MYFNYFYHSVNLFYTLNTSKYFKHLQQLQMFSITFNDEASKIFQMISNAFKNQKSILMVFLFISKSFS